MAGGRSSSSPGTPVFCLGSSGHSGSAPSSLPYRAGQNAGFWGARPRPGGVQGLLAAGEMRPPPFVGTSWTTPRPLPALTHFRTPQGVALPEVPALPLAPFGVARAEAPSGEGRGPASRTRDSALRGGGMILLACPSTASAVRSSPANAHLTFPGARGRPAAAPAGQVAGWPLLLLLPPPPRTEAVGLAGARLARPHPRRSQRLIHLGASAKLHPGQQRRGSGAKSAGGDGGEKARRRSRSLCTFLARLRLPRLGRPTGASRSPAAAKLQRQREGLLSRRRAG